MPETVTKTEREPEGSVPDLVRLLRAERDAFELERDRYKRALEGIAGIPDCLLDIEISLLEIRNIAEAALCQSSQEPRAITLSALPGYEGQL